jgi:biotin transport system substrate-specific component
MARPITQSLAPTDRVFQWAQQTAIVVGASLFVALCARITLPLPFTPVPLTLQNFGVLLVGLMLGSQRGFAALALYLAEGLGGMPVFNPAGPGALAQLLGPTGGYLLAYPFVAALVGWIAGGSAVTFFRAAVAGVLGEVLLFASGISWLFVFTHSFAQALRFGFYWFIFAEIIKVMLAAGITSGWRRARKAEKAA